MGELLKEELETVARIVCEKFREYDICLVNPLDYEIDYDKILWDPPYFKAKLRWYKNNSVTPTNSEGAGPTKAAAYFRALIKLFNEKLSKEENDKLKLDLDELEISAKIVCDRFSEWGNITLRNRSDDEATGLDYDDLSYIGNYGGEENKIVTIYLRYDKYNDDLRLAPKILRSQGSGSTKAVAYFRALINLDKEERKLSPEI